VKINARRQVTLPARVLDALGAKPGDLLELRKGADGYILRLCAIDRSKLAPLRGKLPQGCGRFDLADFRKSRSSPPRVPLP
jgi:AbrB family looped-hinge helix DNA binding protein